jgi:periplasmic divalent cation tolerance protein
MTTPASTGLLLVLTTEANGERAEALARTLLERRLVACVALTPQSSHYWWQDGIERSQEVQLLIKTHPAQLAALEQAVRELHSYSTPEWIHWPAQASPDYSRWLAESCGIPAAGLSPGAGSPAP